MTILFKVEGLTRKIYKVTGLRMTILFKVQVSHERSIKSQALRMTILFKVQGLTRKIDKVTVSQDHDFGGEENIQTSLRL